MKLKKMIKENWLYSIIYTLGLFGAIVAGWLLGRPNMLHAATIGSTNIHYNDNTVYEFTGAGTHDVIRISGNTTGTQFVITKSTDAYLPPYIDSGSAVIYTNCTINSNIITCPRYYNVSYTSSGNLTPTNTSTTWTLGDSIITSSLQFNGNNIVFNEVSSGYTQAQYEAYGQQQYNSGYSAGIAYVQNHPAEYNLYTAAQYSANYTAGQNAVINSPNTYGLYTQAQYEANYTSGYNAGIAYVQNHPGEYNLYTTAQYNAYGTAQYTSGQNAVLNNPNSYNLYTTAQYNAYGSSQYTAGETAVQNDPNSYGLYTQAQMNSNYQAGIDYVVAHPDEYNLYTAAQYNANAQAQYNAGYTAGQQASTNYQDGIQYVLDHPGEYNLYTTAQYNAYGSSQYTAGQNSVINDPNEYGLYNQVQMETAEQNSYSEGYQDGVDSYSYQTIVPTFTGSFYYACTNNASPGGWCESNSSINDNPTINFSNYANYTTNVAYPESMGNLMNSGYNIEQANYYILMDTIQSGASVIAIPESVTDIYIQFCESYNSYYILGTEYNYCRSIATNVPNYSPSGAVYGIDDIYNNPGIYVGNIDRIENGYRILELNNYLVGSSKNWRFLQVLLGDDSTIQTQYSNFSLTYISSPLDAEAYNYGYQTGYTNGNKIGEATSNKNEYNRGYNEGWKDAGHIDDNSVAGIAHTVLSTPVQMFKDIFDVEFLDINLAGFIMSIFTIIVVIWLIKKFW